MSSYLFLFLLNLGLYLVTNNCSASVYKTPPKNLKFQGRFHYEIKNMPSIKNQGNIGLCYAFTAATMLEFYNCKNEKKSCKNLLKEKQYSALDIAASMGRNRIKEGGVTHRILENMARKLKISSEKCASYSQLNIKDKFNLSRKKKQSWARNSNNGFEILENFHQSLIEYGQVEEKSLAQKKCYEYILKDILPLEANQKQMIKALDKSILSEFLYQILIPEKCIGRNYLKLPAYKSHSYPLVGQTITFDNILHKIESVLSSGNILGLSFCPKFIYSKKYNKNICSGHSAVISGMKEVCDDKKKCKVLLKIHNSYGEYWQKNNNNGWLEAGPIIESVIKRQGSFYGNRILSWITKPNENISSIKKRKYGAKVKAKRTWRRPSPLLLYKKNQRSRGQKGIPVFKCTGELGFTYKNKGPHCKVIKYLR